MKPTKIKGLIFSVAILMATSLGALAQTSSTTQKSPNHKHKSADSQQFSNTMEVANSGNSIFDEGSSAQVRHDRIGSLCPGGVSNVGKNSVRSSKNEKPSKELNGIEQNP
jgi:hypothetical protein